MRLIIHPFASTSAYLLYHRYCSRAEFQGWVKMKSNPHPFYSIDAAADISDLHPRPGCSWTDVLYRRGLQGVFSDLQRENLFFA